MTANGEEADLEDADPPRSTPAAVRSRKSPSAFRTISEVADELHIPQHVLRFWETRFPQVKPLKRGGGRRYYRPDDISLLRSIAHLLYIQGYTIKGVQRLLREGGGALSEDIPPASEAERREGDLVDELDLSPPTASTITPTPQGAEPRIRDMLLDMLAELEAMRALLPD